MLDDNTRIIWLLDSKVQLIPNRRVLTLLFMSMAAGDTASRSAFAGMDWAQYFVERASGWTGAYLLAAAWHLVTVAVDGVRTRWRQTPRASHRSYSMFTPGRSRSHSHPRRGY